MKRPTKRKGKLVPERLAPKLRQIRAAAQLTQGKMLQRVNPNETDETNRARISQYEKGIRAPSYVEISNYAAFAGVALEILFDDACDLPNGDQMEMSETPSANTKTGTESGAESTSGSNSISETKIESMSKSEDTNENKETENPAAEKSTPVTDEQQHPEGGTSTAPADTPSALPIAGDETSRMPISNDLLNRLKPIYLHLLEELPFEKMSNLSFDKLLNYVLAAALDDHRQSGTESVLARYLKQLADQQ